MATMARRIIRTTMRDNGDDVGACAVDNEDACENVDGYGENGRDMGGADDDDDNDDGETCG